MANSYWRGEVGKAETSLIDVVERKVKAATTVATVVGFVTTLLGSYVFHGTVPEWAVAGVGSVVTGALTFVAGWLAKQTPRTPSAAGSGE